MKRLKSIIDENEHSSTLIDYLKVDIEEAEFKRGGLEDWISSGALDNVDQLAMELHCSKSSNEAQNKEDFIYYLSLIQKLYKMGFRLISQEVNMIVGKTL